MTETQFRLHTRMWKKILRNIFRPILGSSRAIILKIPSQPQTYIKFCCSYITSEHYFLFLFDKIRSFFLFLFNKIIFSSIYTTNQETEMLFCNYCSTVYFTIPACGTLFKCVATNNPHVDFSILYL